PDPRRIVAEGDREAALGADHHAMDLALVPERRKGRLAGFVPRANGPILAGGEHESTVGRINGVPHRPLVSQEVADLLAGFRVPDRGIVEHSRSDALLRIRREADLRRAARSIST